MGDARWRPLIEAYEDAFDGWRELIGRLEGCSWSMPTGCPGWDVADQLAHVVDVEQVMLGDRRSLPDPPAGLTHVRHDFARFVEAGVHARRGTPTAELVADAERTFVRRLAQLGELPDGYLDDTQQGPGEGMQMRGGQLLRTRIYDVTSHEWDVRRAVGHGSAPAGTGHLVVSFELILRAWARLLPTALGRPGSLAVVVDGAELGRLDLDAGELHRGDGGPPVDATLAVDVSQLLAIAGGRTDAPDVDDTDSDGDLDLVRAVLRSGAITP